MKILCHFLSPLYDGKCGLNPVPSNQYDKLSPIFILLKMPLKQYIKRELLAFAWIMLPYIVVLNLLMFGACIFQFRQRVWQKLFI